MAQPGLVLSTTTSPGVATPSTIRDWAWPETSIPAELQASLYERFVVRLGLW